jgi:hypothetical protein
MVAMLVGRGAGAEENLLSNPGFEAMTPAGFFADWGTAAGPKIGKTLFVERQQPHAGQACLRLRGTPHTWTTCPAKPIAVQPNTDYYIVWWCKAQQPDTSRTYLFLQTNCAQRVFPHTDRRGSFPWTLNIVVYRTRADEKSIAPVLTMHTLDEPPGESWWDELVEQDQPLGESDVGVGARGAPVGEPLPLPGRAGLAVLPRPRRQGAVGAGAASERDSPGRGRF